MQRLLYSKGWISIGLLFASLTFLAGITVARAADLSVGGECCADLEERIAELEATAARKGNRKISLMIYGQVGESLQYLSAPGFTHTQVQGTAFRDQETFIGFAGQAKVSPDAVAGFVLEIDAGNWVNGAANPLMGGNDTNGLGTRQGFVYIRSLKLGGVSIGLQNDATYGITDLAGQAADDIASTSVAHTKLSFRPLVGPGLAAFVADPWDGVRNESVKYSSPEFYGFSLSASWGDAINIHGSSFQSVAQGNIFDVALRYNHDWDQFRVQGAVGYRDGTAIENLPIIGGGLAIQDVRVWSGSAGVMHMPTGLFVNGSYGSMDLTKLVPGSGLNAIKAWEVQGGVEEKWIALGHTTLYAGYGQDDLSQLGLGKPVVYSLGVVQGIDQAAMSVFLSWQEWSQANALLGGKVDVVTGGARIRF